MTGTNIVERIANAEADEQLDELAAAAFLLFYPYETCGPLRCGPRMRAAIEAERAAVYGAPDADLVAEYAALEASR